MMPVDKIISPRICIIDYGLGNLSSVYNICESLGVDVFVSENPESMTRATHLILPGVGSFAEGMKGLKNRKWLSPLHTEVLENKKPILGICLGMQLMATRGFEFEECEGLGWIEGDVVKIEAESHGLKLPHIGWNTLELSPDSLLCKELEGEPFFYFLHSYRFIPKSPEIVKGVSVYGDRIPAVLEKNNLFAVQFHPEKSHTAGKTLLQNFFNVIATDIC